jgi:hypothetical protein
MDTEELERYSLGHTSPAEVERIEEHLLVCGLCRTKLDETEGYAIAMKAAAMELDRKSGRPRWLAIAATAACLVLSVSVALKWRANPQPAIAVDLVATRANAAVTAPAGRPLELHLDLTGLAASPVYRVEVVDQTGKQIWRGDVTPPRPTASVPAQSRGIYFVRIYTRSGDLLREYGLQVGT